MQLRRGQRDHPEVQKKCPDFGKKGLDCIHLWVKFSIPNVVLGASKRKKSKMFLYRAFFIVFDEMPYLVPKNLPYSQEMLVMHSVIIIFAKCFILND